MQTTYRRPSTALHWTVQEGLVTADTTIVCESQVLGTKPAAKRRDSGKRVIDPDQIVRNLTELNMGAPVVHVEHGVGRYLGLQTLTIDDNAEEFLTLGYAGDAKLYVPVTSLHLIGATRARMKSMHRCTGWVRTNGTEPRKKRLKRSLMLRPNCWISMHDGRSQISSVAR